MRRNWRGALWLFALALAVQVFVLAATNVALSRAAGASRSPGEICLRAGGGSAGVNQQIPGPRDRHHDACLLCQLCTGGVAPLAARPNLVGEAPVQWTMLAWAVADRALPAPRQEYSRQARAPPVFS